MKAINNFCAVISVDIMVSVDGNLFIGNTIKLSVLVSSLKYHIGTALPCIVYMINTQQM